MSEALKEIIALSKEVNSGSQQSYPAGSFIEHSVGAVVPNASMNIFAVYVQENETKYHLNYAFRESKYASMFANYLESNLPSCKSEKVRIGIKPIGGVMVTLPGSKEDKEIVLSHNGRFYMMVKWCGIKKMEALATLTFAQLRDLTTLTDKNNLTIYKYLLEHSKGIYE